MDNFLVSTAAALQRAIDDNEVTDDLRVYLANLAELGRGTEQPKSSDAQQFLKETAPLLRKAYLPLGDYISSLERYLSQEFYGDEWFRIVQRRSELEFVRDLYKDVADVDWDVFLDFENVDHMLKNAGNEEGPVAVDRVPLGTPPSHWWWWYPKTPPDATVERARVDKIDIKKP
jgi:hypothetical protein